MSSLEFPTYTAIHLNLSPSDFFKVLGYLLAGIFISGVILGAFIRFINNFFIFQKRKSTEKCYEILNRKYKLHNLRGIESFMRIGGIEDYQKFIENVFDEYDKETIGELMSTETRYKFEIDVVEPDRKEIQKYQDEMIQEAILDVHEEMQTDVRKLYHKADEDNRGKLMDCYDNKLKLLTKGEFDEVSKVDEELQQIKQTIEDKSSKKNSFREIWKEIVEVVVLVQRICRGRLF